MILIPRKASRGDINTAISHANRNIEKVEVLLKTLTALHCEEKACFIIDHEDILVILEIAIKILDEV